MNARHLIYIILFLLAVGIQWPLWFGKGGISRMQSLEAELASIREANDRLRAENDSVAAEIESLESGSGAVEERARMRLGMVKNDEILFRLVPTGEKHSQKLPQLKHSEKPQIFAPKRSDLYIEGAVEQPRTEASSKTLGSQTIQIQ